MTAPLTGDLPDWYRPQVQDTAQEILNYDQSNSAGSHSTTLTLPPNCISIGIGGYSDSISQISVTGATTGIVYLDESLAISEQYPYSIVPVFVRSDDQVTIAWTSDGSVNDHFHVYGYIITPPLALRKDGSLSVIENHAGDQFNYISNAASLAHNGSQTVDSDTLVRGQAFVLDWYYAQTPITTSGGQCEASIVLYDNTNHIQLAQIVIVDSLATQAVNQFGPLGLYIPYDPTRELLIHTVVINTDSTTKLVTAVVFYRIVNI